MKYKEVRPDIDLEMIGVPVGAELVHVKDLKLKCIVIKLSDRPLVVCEGEILTLTAAAKKRTYSDTRGPEFWKYGKETLQERRERFEEYHRKRVIKWGY